jgi:type II secretory pathway component PulC
MRASKWLEWRGRRHAIAALAVALVALVGAAIRPAGPDETVAVVRLAARWVEAASTRDPACFDLLSRSGKSYYPRMRRLALHADAAELQGLPVVDQLQVLFLRGMLEPKELEAMSEPRLLLFALEQGFIGANLRSKDELREVVVGSEDARGRLYKFGLDARPERGFQYFVREDGTWRVDLRGELERLRSDFDAFAARSGLSESEAAFFILEMRLMRKVTPADFASSASPEAVRTQPQENATPVLRLVAVRRPLDSELPFVATIEDRAESLRYLLEPGDVLPASPGIRLVEVRLDAAVLETSQGRITLPLDREGPPLNERLRLSSRASLAGNRSLLEIAAQGSAREGLMAQWRNVGLRDRPLLLQQAWLTPVHDTDAGPSERMRGLRVRKLTEGSFWAQLGAVSGDLLTAVNGRALDSLDAWQDLLEIAQNDQAITLTLEREARQLAFQTRTIRPH